MTGSITVAVRAGVRTGTGAAVRRECASTELVVANHTPRAIWSLHARANRDGGWGQDLLSAGLLPGEERVWMLEPGFYHLRAETGDGVRLHHFGVSLQPGQTVTWTLSDSR